MAGLGLALLAASPVSAQGPTLVIAQGADITTLDPTQATQIHNLNLFYNLYDALVTWDPKDIGKVVPELAVSWRSVNPTTWQFKLRQGVKFHNGEPFNAEAAKFTIDRLITKGVHQVYGGFATIERAEVVDPYTINVVTSKPDPILVKRFAGYGGQMLPPQYLKQVDWKDFALKPVGTGPYKFVEWVKDDRVVLEANDAYWRGAPKIKKVVWRPIPDNFARVAALTRGEAQLITKVIPDHVAQLEKAGCCRVEHTLTNLNTVYLINAQKGPLANTKVRQALNYAVDKNKIIKELYNGYAIPIGSGIPNTDFGFNPAIKPYPYDPAMAKKLLAEAGFANGLEIELQSGNGIHLNDKQLTEAVAAMLAEVGVTAKVTILEPSTRDPAPAQQHLPGPAAGGSRQHHVRRRRRHLAAPRARRHRPEDLAGELRGDALLPAHGRGAVQHGSREAARRTTTRSAADLPRRGAGALPVPGRADRRRPERGRLQGARRPAHHRVRHRPSLAPAPATGGPGAPVAVPVAPPSRHARLPGRQARSHGRSSRPASSRSSSWSSIMTGDPVMMLLPPNPSREEVEALTRALGLDQPVHVQYWRFVKKLLRGDFGTSLQHQQPAMRLVMERLPASMLLAVTALGLAVLLSVPLGIAAARAAGHARSTGSPSGSPPSASPRRSSGPA